MRSIFTTLVVAATALVWLFVVTLAPEENLAASLLRDFALFLTSLCAARLVEVTIAALVDDRRAHHATSDLVRVMSSVVIYIGALIAWLYFGLGFNVTSLLATSAVVTVVLGFALQTTLGNLFTGLSLELERPIRVGDYLRKTPHEGTIVALKWRSIHLRTSNGSLVVLPNSALAAAPVEMIPKASPVRHMATFHVPASVPPVRVLGLIQEAVAGNIHPAVLASPAPSAVMVGTEVQSSAILYGVRFFTDQPADLTTLSSLVLARIWALLQRDGIAMTGRPHESWGWTGQDAHLENLPQPVPPALLAAGRRLQFGAGETLPPDLAGLVLVGSLHEEYLEHEFDLAAAVMAVTDGEPPAAASPRLSPVIHAAIAREAAIHLGPIAATLAERFAHQTEDPYLVYHALATRIPAEADRLLFLAGAPPRPVHRLSAGEAFGWRALLGYEPAAVRSRSTPLGAEVLVFTPSRLPALLQAPAGVVLGAALSRSATLQDITPESLRSRLDAVALRAE